MKKILSLLFAIAAMTTTATAQSGHAAMAFAGKSDFYVTMMGNKAGETSLESDTILYEGQDFTLPSMKYNDMVIPSFKITGTTFTGGYGGVTWADQTFTSTATDANDNEKSITGTSLKGSFTHADGIYRLQLEISFKYGAMPFPITYRIDGFYVKEYSGTNRVKVGGQFGPYSAPVAYKVRTYLEDGATLMDVEVPSYSLSGTVMGNLALGSYTVKGLEYDSSKGGFYRDYATDGLTMRFTAQNNGMTTMDSDYALAAIGAENILVTIANGKACITNNFKPGVMPFQITATMNQNETTAIGVVGAIPARSNATIYNIAGQRTKARACGLMISNGRKYFAE